MRTEIQSAHNKFLNTSLVTPPAAGTFGTAATRFTQFRSFASHNEDLGLQKDFRFSEKYRGQLRAQFLNASTGTAWVESRPTSRIRSSGR